jgi:hypothetical protein
MSIQLLLENFLGLMKEEGELNKFLPMLASGMGHKMIYYPDRGVKEYGVDALSVGKDETDGEVKLFMWLIKCGNITRSGWSSEDQSVKQSIDDVETVFLTTHVLPQHRKMAKKLVILTNGEYHSSLRLTIAQYLHLWNGRTGCESEVVGGSTLASWTERYLLDEHVLPYEHQTLFRRILANVASPELCVPVGRELIRALFVRFNEQGKSPKATLKARLTAFRATRTALSVIFQWAQSEGSLESGRQLSEFALLESWVALQPLMGESGKGSTPLVQEFNELLVQYVTVGVTYSNKIAPYFLVENSFGLVSGDALVTTDLVFREIGQLGLQGSMWAFLSVGSDGAFSEMAANSAASCARSIRNALTTHSCTQSPAFDNHALDIHVALLCLMVTGEVDVAITWLAKIVQRLDFISQFDQNMRYWPMHADFADALEVRHDADYPRQEFMNVSTLLPIILLWSSGLGIHQLYDVIRDRILPRVPNTTMNMWSADQNFDALVNDQAALHDSGFGHPMTELPNTMDEFIQQLRVSSPSIPSVESSNWYKVRAPFIPLLAARHWRLQIPKQMLVEHVLAVSRDFSEQL